MNELKTTEVTVKKDHPCGWCGETIKKGERAFYRVYIGEGFTTEYQHPECYEAMSNAPKETGIYDDGYEFGDFVRGSCVLKDDLPREEE